MNYRSVYHKICKRGTTRIKTKLEYYEKHHIIPKCLNGSDESSNITLLTAREHFIAHWLLCKIYKNEKICIKSKLSSAFNRMCYHNTQNRKITSRQFEVARKEYSINHPMKNPETRLKVSESHKKRNRQLNQIKLENLPACLCGCGNKVSNEKYKYLYNHWDRSKTVISGFTKEVRQQMSLKAKLNISQMSLEDKKNRLNKSLHSSKIDHIKRGKKISESKKGKKTNQREISGKRYANMSDKDFELYLFKNISPCKHKNLTNLRNIWLKQ